MPSMAKQKRLIAKAIKLLGNRQTSMADALECSQTMVWKLLNGHARVSIRMARKIHRATHGECAEYELRPDFFERPTEAA